MKRSFILTLILVAFVVVGFAQKKHSVAKATGPNDIAPVGVVKNISDSALLDIVQRQTFRYFWDFAHPVSGLAREREGIATLCQAPTEYRILAKRTELRPVASLRRLVSAGEPLNPEVMRAFRAGLGLDIADGYGQTETGQVTGVRPGESPPPGSMGRPLPGVRVEIVGGELCVDPATVPTFFLGYDGASMPEGWWRTGDQVRQDEDGWLFFESRADDVIISAGYRIGPAEVESTLLGHRAVREVAVIGVPDQRWGERIKALIVTAEGETVTEEEGAGLP